MLPMHGTVRTDVGEWRTFHCFLSSYLATLLMEATIWATREAYHFSRSDLRSEFLNMDSVLARNVSNFATNGRMPHLLPPPAPLPEDSGRASSMERSWAFMKESKFRLMCTSTVPNEMAKKEPVSYVRIRVKLKL